MIESKGNTGKVNSENTYNWVNVTSAITRAKKIDVSFNQKKVATFTLIKASIDEIGQNLTECAVEW